MTRASAAAGHATRGVPPGVAPDLAQVRSQASRDAGSTPSELLDGFLEILVDVSTTGRQLSRQELEGRRAAGVEAAERGIPLRHAVDLYLSATRLAWPLLPGVCRAAAANDVRRIGESVFRAADASIVAVAEGYEGAQRSAIRQEESLRREFIDDLLGGTNLGRIAENAQRYGLRLAHAHLVAVAMADEPFYDGDPAARRLERELFTRFGSREVLITTKDGLLVCIAQGGDRDVDAEFARQIELVLGSTATWRVALGQAYPGPGGVVRSFEQARAALDVAERLGFEDRVINASRLLVFQVLLRDSAALSELVTSVLGPLHQARGGAQPLIDTLLAYFDNNGVATSTAQSLGIGVRTVTNRLDRIAKLTGYTPADPLQRLALEVAVRGASVLHTDPATQNSKGERRPGPDGR